MSYQGQECFGKNDLEEIRDELQQKYGAKGETLYIAVEEKIKQDGVACRNEIDRWREYLEKEFDDEELEKLAVATLESTETSFNNFSTS